MFMILDDLYKVESPKDAHIFAFPAHAFMQNVRLALLTHLGNLVMAFGEDVVREFMKEQFNLTEARGR